MGGFKFHYRGHCRFSLMLYYRLYYTIYSLLSPYFHERDMPLLRRVTTWRAELILPPLYRRCLPPTASLACLAIFTDTLNFAIIMRCKLSAQARTFALLSRLFYYHIWHATTRLSSAYYVKHDDEVSFLYSLYYGPLFENYNAIIGSTLFKRELERCVSASIGIMLVPFTKPPLPPQITMMEYLKYIYDDGHGASKSVV